MRYEIYIPHKQYSFYINKKYSDGTIFSFGNKDDFSIQSPDIVLYGDPYEIIELNKSVSKLSDNELYSEYHDFDKFLPARYALVHNEMIDRGLLHSVYVLVNDYILKPSYFSILKPDNFNFLHHAKAVYPSYTISSALPKIKIRNLSDAALQKEFKELNFFDDETRYALLSYEMNKRNLL
jgi:hypothetical protein